jgi:hypothetical protein
MGINCRVAGCEEQVWRRRETLSLSVRQAPSFRGAAPNARPQPDSLPGMAFNEHSCSLNAPRQYVPHEFDQAHSITRDSDHVPGVSSQSNAVEAAVFPHVGYEGVQLAREFVGLAERRKDLLVVAASRRLRSILQRSCQWQAISAPTLQRRRPEMTDGCVQNVGSRESSRDRTSISSPVASSPGPSRARGCRLPTVTCARL